MKRKFDEEFGYFPLNKRSILNLFSLVENQSLLQIQIRICAFSIYQESHDPHFSTFKSVFFKRDPTNKIDSKAIAVYRDKTLKDHSGYVQRDDSKHLSLLMDEYTEIEFHGTCTFVSEMYAYVNLEIIGPSNLKSTIRKKLSKFYNMTTEEESKKQYDELLNQVSIYISENDEIETLFLLNDGDVALQGELMKVEDFKGYTLFDTSVKICDKETKELIIAYERNSPEFDEKFDQKFTVGEKFTLHFEGIDSCPELHPPLNPKNPSARVNCGCRLGLNRSGDFKNETSPVYMQGYRVNLTTRNVGKYEWDDRHPRYFNKSITFYKTLTSIFHRFLPEIAKKQENLLLDVTKIDSTIYSNAAISKNYYSRIHLDSQEYHWTHLTILKRGTFRGGWIVFPEYKIAFSMLNKDCLFFQSQNLLHGTGPFFPVDNALRIGVATQINERIYHSKK
jgi:hypothetical protein